MYYQSECENEKTDLLVSLLALFLENINISRTVSPGLTNNLTLV